MIYSYSQAVDVLGRARRGGPVSADELRDAARFFLTVSAPRRMAKARALADVADGLSLARLLGWADVPQIESFGDDGYIVADRAAAWYATRK